jgi:hypothetical protein
MVNRQGARRNYTEFRETSSIEGFTLHHPEDHELRKEVKACTCLFFLTFPQSETIARGSRNWSKK